MHVLALSIAVVLSTKRLVSELRSTLIPGSLNYSVLARDDSGSFRYKTRYTNHRRWTILNDDKNSCLPSHVHTA